jgi:hypothetical protein
MAVAGTRTTRLPRAKTLLAGTALVVFFMLSPHTANTQQITGTPGSPSATTTIDGNYIPNPPPAFGGEINLNAKDSKPWWPPNIVPPKGAPNILLIMTDDQGYGISGTYLRGWRPGPSTSVPTRARRWTTPTTRCHSPSPAR